MDYFLLKQSGTVSIPKAPPEKASDPMEPSVRTIGQVGILDKFDYIARERPAKASACAVSPLPDMAPMCIYRSAAKRP